MDMNNTTITNVVQKEPFALMVVLRIFYAMVFFVGLCGNLLVCIVVIQQRRMRTVINYFTLNLAMSDLIIIVIYLPSQLAAYENDQNFPFGNVGCRIIYSIVPVCLTASISTLLAISCERFRGIVFPFQPRLSITAVRNIIITIWFLSFGTALPVMIVAGTIQKNNNVFCDENWSSEISSRFYWISMFLLQYVIPLFVMIILYGIAGWKLRKRSTLIIGSRNYNINSVAENTRQRQSQKITKMLVALILLYSFCMLPQHIIYFWITYGAFWDWPYSLIVFRISNLFPMANSALNSIAYGTLQTDFRNGYKKLFKSCNFFSHNKTKQIHLIKRRQGHNRADRKLQQERKEADPYLKQPSNRDLNVDTPLLLRDTITTSDSSRQLDDVDINKDSRVKNTELQNIRKTTFVQVINKDTRTEITTSTNTTELNLIFDIDIRFLKHSKETNL